MKKILSFLFQASNVSTIDGLIRANGSANLFLINPAGIIFGEGAQLDIGGSFLGSTASSILFDDGEFSATDVDSPPLLTINAPIGLGLADNPGEIVNRSTVQDSKGIPIGLEVLAGNNLSLVGGNLRFEGGNATAKGGKVELGGLSTAGRVDLSENGNLTFPENIAKADVTLSDSAVVDVGSIRGGDISVNARNLDLTASFLIAGITADSTSDNAQAGDIEINLTDNLILDQSRITNQVNQDGVGNSGNININTGSLKITNGGIINASTFGQGNAGNVTINATKDVTFEGLNSLVVNEVSGEAVGDAGNINITTGNLTLTDGGKIGASTAGQGDGGDINLTAREDIILDGSNNRSSVFSQVNQTGEGNAGGVTITTDNLTLTDGGRVDADTSGQGNAGLVKINASDTISIDGEGLDGVSSRISSRVNSDGVGNAEGVKLFTGNLSVTDGGYLDASTFGQGNAGSIDITASDITFEGETSTGFPSSAFSQVNPGGVGNAGGVTIDTDNLTLTNGGLVSANTLGQGNSGDVNISTNQLTMENGGRIEASNFDQTDIRTPNTGKPGNITIEANSIDLINQAEINAVTKSATGVSGIINLQVAEDITLDNNSLISAEALENANGGNLNIDARFLIAFPDSDSDIIASAEQGQGGNITINAESVFGIEERPLNPFSNDINASSEFGLSGTVEIDVVQVDPSQASLDISVEKVETEVAQTCEANSSGNQSEFVVTGRGGLPTEPEDNFRLPAIATAHNTVKSEPSAQQQPEVSPPIIEATTWVRNEKGKILLLASPSNLSSLNAYSNLANCNS